MGYILQEKQTFMRLDKALQNNHLGQPRITFLSPCCVAGMVRSIITIVLSILSPSIITGMVLSIITILKLLEGGNATGVQQSSMLGFYGERVCRRRNQTWTFP